MIFLLTILLLLFIIFFWFTGSLFACSFYWHCSKLIFGPSSQNLQLLKSNYFIFKIKTYTISQPYHHQCISFHSLKGYVLSSLCMEKKKKSFKTFKTCICLCMLPFPIHIKTNSFKNICEHTFNCSSEFA